MQCALSTLHRSEPLKQVEGPENGQKDEYLIPRNSLVPGEDGSYICIHRLGTVLDVMMRTGDSPARSCKWLYGPSCMELTDRKQGLLRG